VCGDEIGSPDFVALSRAYGGDGVHVRSAADVEGALAKAFERSGGNGVYVRLARYSDSFMLLALAAEPAPRVPCATCLRPLLEPGRCRGGAGFFVVEVAVDPKLKAKYARVSDESVFVSQVCCATQRLRAAPVPALLLTKPHPVSPRRRQLRESLADLLPSNLRPSELRKLIAFDTDGNGMLSADELAAARKILCTLKAREKPEEFLALLRTGQLFKNPALTSAKHVRACLPYL
jgi:hypothetical protein